MINRKLVLLFVLFWPIIFGLSCQQPTTSPIPTSNNFVAVVDYESKLSALEITLESPSAPVANYVNVVGVDNLLFLSGKGPKMPDGQYIKGKLGQDLTEEEGYAAAQRVGVLQLAVLKDHLGDLNKVKRIVKVMGMVNCTTDFGNQPEVINGFSDLMVAVFGEKGKHARAAVGMAALPRNMAVEIEMIVETY